MVRNTPFRDHFPARVSTPSPLRLTNSQQICVYPLVTFCALGDFATIATTNPSVESLFATLWVFHQESSALFIVLGLLAAAGLERRDMTGHYLGMIKRHHGLEPRAMSRPNCWRYMEFELIIRGWTCRPNGQYLVRGSRHAPLTSTEMAEDGKKGTSILSEHVNWLGLSVPSSSLTTYRFC